MLTVGVCYINKKVTVQLQLLFLSVSKMSRNNVFKLSGNMAIGGGDAMGSNDLQNIKNSLKLLRSKQTQKRQEIPLETNNYANYAYNPPSQPRGNPNPKNFSSNDNQNGYNYGQNGGRASNNGGSYKDTYNQQYPSYESKPQKPSQNYEQPSYQQRGDGHKPSIKVQASYQPPSQKDTGYEQKSIKEINRQNRTQIKEYRSDELVECGQCGRKFNPDSIQKHEGICRKVFQEKRKKFNTQDQRLVANQQKKLMKKGEMIEKKIEEKKANEKVPKWKAESLQLRSGIKNARGDDYQPTKEQRQMLQAAKASSQFKCHCCGRSFNEQAAKKHIPFCEAQQKKNQMKRK